MGELERKLCRVLGGTGATNTSTASFMHEILEVKRFSSWKGLLDEGATRADANELMKLQGRLLPQELQSHVHPFKLRGLRNYTVKVLVRLEFMCEMHAIRSKHLGRPNV